MAHSTLCVGISMHHSPNETGLQVLDKQLSCSLGLTRQLVGVTFHFSRDSFEQSDANLTRKPLTYCSLVRMASSGLSRKAGFEEISCPGAKRALGLEPVNEEFRSGQRYMSLGLYKDLECARKTSAVVSIMDRQIHGVSMEPLSDCSHAPHVVIAICNPNQSMRLVQGYIHENGPIDSMRSMGQQGLCAELTVHPYLTGEPNVSLLCSNTRYISAWDDNELGVGIPAASLASITDGVLKTINAAESDANKDIIIDRAQAMGFDLGITKGTAYYQSPKKTVPDSSLPPSPNPDPTPKSQRIAIKVHSVSKSHTQQSGSSIKVLDTVSLEVHEQEFLTFVGPSGCGKSTLLNLMAGRYAPDSGTISLPGSRPQNGLNLGFISQADTLLPWRTVRKNVELGLEIRKVPTRERHRTADRLMEQVGLLEFANSYPFELSGGMKQRASVIRALAYDPDVIFMDEPFVGLDVQTRDALEQDILTLWLEHKKTIVMVTHDLGEAITLSDRVILFSGRPATIKAEYDIPLPRPRSVVESKFTDEFVSIHKRIWQDLSAEVLNESQGGEHA
ncbi:DUF169 domain-containing protein [Pseudodesulfovibrio sp. zrk46]|uniref:DUF169 domain-containing protein n=1 Tax=Pseudodesulfovibrio sp. zrk46 TaxID=2725288 RepID=UPI0032B5B3B1